MFNQEDNKYRLIQVEECFCDNVLFSGKDGSNIETNVFNHAPVCYRIFFRTNHLITCV